MNITITIGRTTLSTALLAPTEAGAKMAAGRLADMAERAGYKMFEGRRRDIEAAVFEQAQSAIEAAAQREIEDAALLAAHPGARVSYPLAAYPFRAERPATARDLLVALAKRRGDEPRVVIERFDVGVSAGQATEVIFAA